MYAYTESQNLTLLEIDSAEEGGLSENIHSPDRIGICLVLQHPFCTMRQHTLE